MANPQFNELLIPHECECRLVQDVCNMHQTSIRAMKRADKVGHLPLFEAFLDLTALDACRSLQFVREETALVPRSFTGNPDDKVIIDADTRTKLAMAAKNS